MLEDDYRFFKHRDPFCDPVIARSWIGSIDYEECVSEGGDFACGCGS